MSYSVSQIIYDCPEAFAIQRKGFVEVYEKGPDYATRRGVIGVGCSDLQKSIAWCIRQWSEQ